MSYRKVVYVALGANRVAAAKVYAQQLASAGAHVDLVVSDRPEWIDYDAPDAVTVHRISAPGAREAADAARRMVLRRSGLLRGADLFVMGDLHALPVAWEVARRHRGLEIRLEPSEAGRRQVPHADLAVVTPWYPCPNNPSLGAFLPPMVRAVRDRFQRVSVFHIESWRYPIGVGIPRTWFSPMVRRLMSRAGVHVVEDRPEAQVTRVAAPLSQASRDYARWAVNNIRALRLALPTGRIEAPLVHAHVGIYGGVAAVELARPDARIIVTEHASFLPDVLNQPAARHMYERVLDRAEALVCVSQHLAEAVCDRFSYLADKVHVIPNVVDFDLFTARPSPPRDLLRWLYVGRLLESKGVPLLLEAFRQVAASEPRATLTLVGDGPMREALQARVAELGLSDRVTIRPPVPPTQVPDLLRSHDLLVHASPSETFGMTAVEAVATGTPVLVARSQGPAETLAGLDGVAGVLFEVSDDPEVIVEGYRKLRASLSTLDLSAARQNLVARFSPQVVASALHDLYTRPEPAAVAATAAPSAAEDAGPGTRAGRVLIIAMDPTNAKRVRPFAAAALERGYAVDLLTAESRKWRQIGLDRRVRIHYIGDHEKRRFALRAERFLVYWLPLRMLATARRLASRGYAIRPELIVGSLQRFHRRSADAFHHKLFNRAYQIVRPRTLWRVVRREVLPQLDLAATRHVVVAGRTGVTIGWRIARRYRHLTVTTSLSLADLDQAQAVAQGPAAR